MPSLWSMQDGTPTLGVKDRKCAGVNVTYEFMSSPTYVRGLELTTASASFSYVRSCSFVKHTYPIALRSDLLTRVTSLS